MRFVILWATSGFSIDGHRFRFVIDEVSKIEEIESPTTEAVY